MGTVAIIAVLVALAIFVVAIINRAGRSGERW
jgi:hypothetical protein